MPAPLCFVLMPFGQKPDPGGGPPIDFDAIYTEGIAPAIRAAGLEPLRADAERVGGIIHKPMFERLLLCEFAVADLSTANANVFYELGVRHAARPRTTQPIVAARHRIPFDVAPLRALEYQLGPGNRFGPEQADALRDALANRLQELRSLHQDTEHIDSPLFQLLGEWEPGRLSHEKTDVFRDQIHLARKYRKRLDEALTMEREAGLAHLAELREDIEQAAEQEAGLLVALYLTYRDLKAYDAMVDLYARMPEPLKRQIMVREQLAFALNRRAGERGDPADRQRAIEILQEILDQQGPSPETCGLLGRIYKDRWMQAREDEPLEARSWLRRATDAYRQGFEADWRDPYPGVNAVTLLELLGDGQALADQARLLPVVRFAAEQRARDREPDYWDHATLLELAVLAEDQTRAEVHAADALAAARAGWELESTATQLDNIKTARAGRGVEVAWMDPLVDALRRRATKQASG